MRRVLAIFTALAVVLALATPAMAKKGGDQGPPRDDQDFVSVTMGLTEGPNGSLNNGLATTCNGPLNMRVDNRGGMVAGGGSDPEGESTAALDVIASDITWARSFPAPALEAGCHGGPSSTTQVPGYGEPSETAGLLLINLEGRQAGLLWHFDYYTAGNFGRKGRTLELVREHFTMQSTDDFAWDGSKITGTFTISYSLRDRVTGNVEYETLDAMYFEFTLTVNP